MTDPTRTPADIKALTLRSVSETLAPCGHVSQAFVYGHRDFLALLGSLDAAVRADDLEATKDAGRAMIRKVRDWLEPDPELRQWWRQAEENRQKRLLREAHSREGSP